MNIKNSYIFLVVLLLAALISGCYRNEPVESYEVGLKLSDGVSISDVVGPGIHSDSGWRAELVVVNASNITTPWNDPSLVTSDKQPIGLTLALTFSRKRDKESITSLYSRYNREAVDDASLTNLVLSKVPGVAKTVTTRHRLDDMLGVSAPVSGTTEIAFDRTQLATEVFELLETELNLIYVELAAVEIVDIAPSAEYLKLLNDKALAQAGVELASEQTKLITEQLNQEKAQTNIDIERARRDNLVNAERAKAFEQSPQLLQLEMLRLTAQMLDAGDVVIYVPEGSNITSVLTQGAGQVIPTD